ncbi:hypothetical protein Tsubulata_028041 [Turnera subulata]|uniref:EGF-like domain-containing protein n=1 Tax=Turnera subulata TaxID=218843 RepID=A0A9Q0FB55_9ROSI|nr:hypothetical protein Tsubulata_028041 [Turnera subulata]
MATYIRSTTYLLGLLLVLQPMIASSDFLSPLLSPVLDDVCKHVECGKGTCKPSQNSSFFYECECDQGWKQTRADDDEFLQFLPCIVPNCSMDYSCMAAAPPSAKDKTSKANESIFDPCFWTDCGGGSCNKTSKFTYNCACEEGYYNLLNVSSFPCFRECAIGMDCSRLGIPMSNKSASPTSALSEDGKNRDKVCKHVECGKGTCKPSRHSGLFYECECDQGWKQTRPDNDDFLKFLPCIVPNCSMDYSCMPAPPPSVKDKTSKDNKSILDPCFWTDCGGGGSCNRTSKLTYNCVCQEGYYNLFNKSSFPCFKECAIGMDCMRLGITVSNTSASPTSALSDNGKSGADSVLETNFSWLMIFFMSLGLIQWN